MNLKNEENTVLNYFCYVLINEILPFEAKYISLRKNKNFTFIRQIIQLFLNDILPNANKLVTKETFNDKYLSKIEQTIKVCKAEYLGLLIKYNIKDKDKSYYNNFKKKYLFKRNNKYGIKNELIEEAIIDLENYLDVGNEIIKKNQLNITDIDKHISSDIYKGELELLNQQIKKFHKYYLILERKLYENGFIKKIDENTINPTDKINNLEYLYFVIIHEFWNFLAHFSMGLIYFNTPNNFLSNLHKSISHLKRAVMDLLDGMIIENNCSYLPEYLQLRVLKISSLGNSIKIQELISRLEKVFTKCLQQNQ